MDGAGTLPDRWALAAGRASTKGCNICHGPRLPGARLCAPCKAALKRARLETVSELVPRPSRASALAREARRKQKAVAAAAKRQAGAVDIAEPSPPMWIIPAIIVAAAALGGLAYLAQRTPTPGVEHPAAAAAAANVSEREMPPMPAPQANPQPGSASATNAVPPTADGSASAASPHLAKPASSSRVAQRRALDAPPTPVAPVVSSAPESAPVATAESVPPVREGPAPDRWQVMADQINRCGRDGFFAGVVCEQKVRLKYCEGYWGQVPQCATGITNDHGQ